MNTEKQRLQSDIPSKESWKYWGPYLSERQWGTVREDYSAHGNAWDYFPHDHARSRAYRWGEDGLAGFSDVRQRLCLSLALWNGRDAILKERLFGLTNGEGNHGEDVKELYYYLDATPTHSYLKMLYKYPQSAFPYSDLVNENRRRGIGAPEYELSDTAAFADNRYFDVFVEYAQAEPGDVLMRVTAHNRGPEAAPLHLIPQLILRNTWSWDAEASKPTLTLAADGSVRVEHPELGTRHFYLEKRATWLFSENESNAPKLWGSDGRGFFKDAFHERIVGGRVEAVNPAGVGTKVGAWHALEVPAFSKVEVRMRLTRKPSRTPFAQFDSLLCARKGDADDFYAELQHGMKSEDARLVQRQAFAGLVWSKQYFNFDVAAWINGDAGHPAPPAGRERGRNAEWGHLNNADVISMPDKWEYPWYAAWDLAFHCIPFALIDSGFAKHQLELLTREWYMHPNGQIPAYEWAFGDVNPPVHAWSAWRVYQIDRKQNGGKGDVKFLERVFHKLHIEFHLVGEPQGRRGPQRISGWLPGPGQHRRIRPQFAAAHRRSHRSVGRHELDGHVLLSICMRIALELAQHNHVYEDIASKFFEHFLHIAEAMSSRCNGGGGLWDEEDEFFYDVLHLPNEQKIKLKVRSMVGLIPLFAIETLEPELLEKLPGFNRRLQWLLKNKPRLAGLVSHWQSPGRGQRRLLSLLRGHRMKKLLQRMLDESEFLSDYGVRAISRNHLEHPYVFRLDGMDLAVQYTPAESSSGLFGGNSNWRGPIWFPLNFLIIESLQKFHHYYGDDFKIECPTGSGRFLTIAQVAEELGRRLSRIFLKDASGKRPVLGHQPQQQSDPLFQDYVPFYEYFHGDSGRGVGASHQTGWTALVAKLLMPRIDHT